MTACTSPLLIPSETPFRISRPSTATCRSLISKSANFLPLCGDVISAAGVSGAQPGGGGDRRPQQPPVGVLLEPAWVPGPGGDVLDRAVAVPELEPAAGALDHLGHVTELAGEPRQLAHPAFEVQAREPAPV